MSLTTAELGAGAGQLGLHLDDQQLERLVAFGDLLLKWNKTFNLVSRQDVGRLGPRHFLDSLAGLTLLHGGRILDLGSGAGLPGIPLAIGAPERSFTLCDRSARRARFLQQAVRELGLLNVEVWLDNYGLDSASGRTFDTVVARGVATAPVVWDMVAASLADHGRVLVYESTQAAIAALEMPQQDEIRISRHSFDIPGLDQTHSILCMERR